MADYEAKVLKRLYALVKFVDKFAFRVGTERDEAGDALKEIADELESISDEYRKAKAEAHHA